MNFQELHDLIPYARFGKVKSLTMTPYDNITLAMPGRHAEDCSPKGGDFVVMVADKNKRWRNHQFTHDDIFKDVEKRTFSSAYRVDDFVRFYRDVINGEEDPVDNPFTGTAGIGGVIHNQTFFYAVQCLAVAEHRRYHQHEEKFGGRFLPFRFAAGIAEGLWTAQDAIDVQKYGRPAVERLEKKYGVPALTKELVS